MLSDRAHFEVHCPRCDVTFAVGTRSCVHCGGRTQRWRPGASFSGSVLPAPLPPSDGPAVTRVDPSTRTLPADDAGPVELRELEDVFDEVYEDDDESTPSTGRSVMSALSGFIWIALVLGFSLFGRLCQGG